MPTVDFSKFGPIESKPLSRIKRISGPRLHASWVNIPHVTHSDEADITDLEAFRKSLDEAAKKDKAKPYRVSLLPLLLRAAVATLKAFPTFNSALSPDNSALIMRRYWHIGVAVDTPDGLVVAVIKDVDQKGVIDLARELGALSEKARAGKLRRPRCRVRPSPSPRSAASAARPSRPSSTRRKWRSSASCARRWPPVWDGERSSRG